MEYAFSGKFNSSDVYNSVVDFSDFDGSRTCGCANSSLCIFDFNLHLSK